MTWIFIRYNFVLLVLFIKLDVFAASKFQQRQYATLTDTASLLTSCRAQGSLHYSTTTDWKLDQKRWDRPRWHINPQGHQFSVWCRPAIENPQPNLTINTQNSQGHPVHSLKRSLYASHATANLISCMGGATHPPNNHFHLRPRTQRQQ